MFFMVFVLLAVDPRMTIHHSGRGHKQENSAGIEDDSGDVSKTRKSRGLA
jgi:hypothetical protein